MGVALTGQDAATQVTGGLFPPPPHPSDFAHLVSAVGVLGKLAPWFDQPYS